MIVYVETNFVVEVALEQEQHGEASTIIALAAQGDIQLAFPSFILAESFEPIRKQHNERNELQNSLVETLNQLRRSEPHKQIMLDMEPVIRVLKDSQKRELDLWHSTLERLVEIGRCLELKAVDVMDAITYQTTLGLSPKDSIIYSMIIVDMKTKPVGEKKCFLSRDSKAFNKRDDRRIKAELEAYNCEYKSSFSGGLGFIQNHLKQN